MVGQDSIVQRDTTLEPRTSTIVTGTQLEMRVGVWWVWREGADRVRSVAGFSKHGPQTRVRARQILPGPNRCPGLLFSGIITVNLHTGSVDYAAVSAPLHRF